MQSGDAVPSRKSGIELIKVFAIITVVLCHAVPDNVLFDGFTYVNGVAQQTAAGFILNFIAGLGLIGDAIFIVCSAYFLCSSKKIKVHKVVYMLLTVLVISLIFLAVYLCLGYEIDTLTIIKQIFPTVFQNNWFISYYIVLYLLHPFINMVTDRLNMVTHGLVVTFLAVHCCILMYVQGDAPAYNKFICMLFIYLLVSFLKKYGQGFMADRGLNGLLCALSAAAYVILRLSINQLGLECDYLYGRQVTYVHINCPVVILFAITLFNVANGSTFNSRAVNYLSSLSMPVYLIHHNMLFAMYTQSSWHEWFLGTLGGGYAIMSTFALAAIFLFGGIAAATVYRFTLGRLIKRISLKEEKLILKFVNKTKLRRSCKKAHSLRQ
ncbi:MAG: acyltransferase [Clostridia bacterium]|nr:acyltransferase [Clostridia bacterium]